MRTPLPCRRERLRTKAHLSLRCDAQRRTRPIGLASEFEPAPNSRFIVIRSTLSSFVWMIHSGCEPWRYRPTPQADAGRIGRHPLPTVGWGRIDYCRPQDTPPGLADGGDMGVPGPVSAAPGLCYEARCAEVVAVRGLDAAFRAPHALRYPQPRAMAPTSAGPPYAPPK
jgi:hypothetical protein